MLAAILRCYRQVFPYADLVTQVQDMEEKCQLLESEKGALQGGQNNTSADAISALTKERGALALNVACGEEVKRVTNV
ncbi:hypothetical protein BDZ89DRAFT_1063574 [Hymenopellis radicata]|nr:hypothetical protein BDZ89DRAFT_1063574 [Hymenopellis radicata]